MSIDELRGRALKGEFPGPSKTVTVEPIKVPRAPAPPRSRPYPCPNLTNRIAARVGPEFVNAELRGAAGRSEFRPSSRGLSAMQAGERTLATLIQRHTLARPWDARELHPG
jgi:hypothetical protein